MIKKILLILSVIGLVFFAYVHHKKQLFEEIYQDRKNPSSQYIDLYNSGDLDKMNDYFMKNFNILPEKNETSVVSELEIKLDELEKVTKDTIILNIRDRLSELGFTYLEVKQYKQSDRKVFGVTKMYLRYKSVPTYHTIMKGVNKLKRAYQFNKNSDWYFYSFDAQEENNSQWLDFRPDWSIPYYEAFEFFEKNDRK